MKKSFPPPGSAPTRVRVAEFKAHLSACLRRVQSGEVITVFDRNQPIARVVPYAASSSPLTIRRGSGLLRDVPLAPARSIGRKVTTLSLLLADRRGGR